MDSSHHTRKVLQRTVYANYIISRQAIDQGIIIRMPASSGDSTIVSAITEGPIVFKPSELKIILQTNSIFPPTPSDSLPGQPTILSGIPDITSVVLTWTTPSNGGSPITSYTVRWGGSQRLVSGTTATITGLTPNTSYTFTVLATNAVGSGPVSAPFSVTTSAAGPGWTLSTYAGGGTLLYPLSGYCDGSDIYVQYDYPTGVATDGNGNIYVADNENHCIRKIDSTGLVTTIAGDGSPGYGTGVGTNARFAYPNGVATDSSGNIYVADYGNNLIRIIDSTGLVTTIAGNGSGGYNGDGSGTDVQFNYPRGVTRGSNGNIYVADTYDHRIRKIDSTGLVTTIAGDGNSSFADGSGTEAKFRYPSGILTDTSENIYVADTNNNRIRMIDSNGVVTTIAGGETPPYADGSGIYAQFRSPYSVATDGNGNIYVADNENHCIRKIDSTGYVTTIAGNGSGGYNGDGSGTDVQFYYPRGVTTDSNGNIYVADTANSRIRKIDSTSYVTTIAGDGNSSFADGSGTDARFRSPRGVTTDSNGNIYVADTANNRIRKIDSTGYVTTLAGNSSRGYNGDGSGTDVLFDYPRGVTTDSNGNIYVADTYNHCIRKIDSSMNVTTIAGSTYGYGTGVGTNARFAYPSGVATDSSGNIYVADNENHRIRKIDSTGLVTTIAGGPQPKYIDAIGTNARFNSPRNLTRDSNGNIYVADRNNNRIRKIDSSMNVTTIAGAKGGYGTGVGTNARFAGPNGLTTDSSGNIYVADTENNVIRMIDSMMNVTSTGGACNVPNQYGYGTGLGTNVLFSEPRCVAIDGNGNIYVSDYENHRIRKIDSTGLVTTIAGDGNNSFADGSGTEAKFNYPRGVATDSSGNIYVADTENNRIRKIDSNGVVTTIAGGEYEFADASGTDAKFRNPRGVAIDGNGNIYVADFYNHRIRKIDSSMNVITIAGGDDGYGTGVGTNARFYYPNGVTTDSNGNIYVADTGNYRIRKIDSSMNVTTIAGDGEYGYGTGVGTNARFNYPTGVATDSSGNIYVADSGNNLIRMIDSSMNVTTLVGGGPNRTNRGSINGLGTNAMLNHPTGLALDGNGNIYVADTYNNTIKKLFFNL